MSSKYRYSQIRASEIITARTGIDVGALGCGVQCPLFDGCTELVRLFPDSNVPCEVEDAALGIDETRITYLDQWLSRMHEDVRAYDDPLDDRFGVG